MHSAAVTLLPPLLARPRSDHHPFPTLLQASRLDEAGAARAAAVLHPGTSQAELQLLASILFPRPEPAPSPAAPSTAGEGLSSPAAAMTATPGSQAGASPLTSPMAEYSPQLADAAAAPAAASASAPRPLMGQLRQLVAMCDVAFSQPRQAVSPSIRQVGCLQLLPLAALAADDSAPLRVAVGAPMALKGAAAPEAHTTTIVCAAPLGAGCSGHQQQLLVVRLAAGGRARSGERAAEEEGWRPGAEACVLLLPAGVAAVDVAVYKAQQLVMLMQGTAGGRLGRWQVHACVLLRACSQRPRPAGPPTCAPALPTCWLRAPPGALCSCDCSVTCQAGPAAVLPQGRVRVCRPFPCQVEPSRVTSLPPCVGCLACVQVTPRRSQLSWR